MVISATLFFLMYAQPNGESLYKGALLKSVEAQYTSSDLKKYVEIETDRIHADYPALVFTGAAIYTLGVQRKIKLNATTIKIIPNTTLSGEITKTQGIAALTWHF